MQEYLEKVKKARIGEIIPIVKVIEKPIDAFGLYAKISNYGKKKYSFFFESADIVPKYGENSLGCSDPCLRVMGKGESFEIKALNQNGLNFLRLLKKRLSFADKLVHKKNVLYGILAPKRKSVSEEERLKLRTHIDIIREIAFAFKPTEKPAIPYAGLFGAVSYDFIDQFEDLPKNPQDALSAPDYELYFADTLFLTDHKKNTTLLIANVLVTEEKREVSFSRAVKSIAQLEKALEKPLPKVQKQKARQQVIEADTPQDGFEAVISALKSHILRGDIFQIVPSRTIISNYAAEPLEIYKALRELNPSPYMFFIAQEQSILLGASPEMSLRVQGGEEKTVEIRPIAGTKPRGRIDGNIDEDLDSRYEAELKIDEKELAEHTMLIDLARNDVAKVSETGTRYCSEPFIIEKYSHVQHLVSNVQGKLKKGLDALHAYLATMNQGTLTGCPKIEAMKLLRKFEKFKRGFYGGAVGYITPSGDMDTTIVIRSMLLKNGKAYIRSGAGIVYDSIPHNEFLETERKAAACLEAIRRAGGLK
ncbi:anthranilate synthase component 1 [Candidatus Woesearchaeota archaeon]|nr:anthranilate synthase component 1 [Candidatus Woesearchaeota archaeon]